MNLWSDLFGQKIFTNTYSRLLWEEHIIWLIIKSRWTAPSPNVFRNDLFINCIWRGKSPFTRSAMYENVSEVCHQKAIHGLRKMHGAYYLLSITLPKGPNHLIICQYHPSFKHWANTIGIAQFFEYPSHR